MTDPSESVAAALKVAWSPGLLSDDQAEHLAQAALGALDTFDGLVWMAQRLLDHRYPSDVFVGTSGDPGVAFVVRLRETLEALQHA